MERAKVSPHLTESSDFAVVCAVGSAGAGRSTAPEPERKGLVL